MQYKQYNAPNINPVGQYEQRIALLENQIRNLNSALKAFFVAGRLRTDRAAPTSSADIETPDQLYDRVLKDDYEYVVINDAGSLAWRRITLASF